MTMKIACVGLTISFLFIGQTAFAQSATEAANEAVVVQTQAQNQTQSQNQAQTQTMPLSASKQATAPRRVKIVREALPEQRSATRKVNKVRVIHTANLSASQMSVYRPKHKPKTTPNLYRD